MTRDEVLAAATPLALFGPDHRDPKALKRSYARLIRAFGPENEPGVFAHIRALYERAQTPDEPAPARNRPIDALREAFGSSNLDEALRIVVTHDLTLRVESALVWFQAIFVLADERTFQLPIELMQSWLSACDDAPDEVPDATVARLESLTLAGIAYQQARNVITTWGKPPLQSAEALMALHVAEPDPAKARANFAALRVRYPGLLMPWQLVVGGVTLEHEAWLAVREGRWQPPQPELLVAVGTRLWDWALIISCLSSLLLFAGNRVLTTAMIAICCVRAVVDTMGRGKLTLSQQLVEVARGQGLFPHEVYGAVTVLPRSWVTYLWQKRYPQDDNRDLADWQSDPTVLPAVLSDLHLDRIPPRG
jgi:hypothetical protein